MRIRQLFLVVFALACTVFAGSANAQDTTGYTYFVHGVPGRDLSPAYDPVLPLDVMFNNTDCILKGWTFGQISGPYSYPAGYYDVKVSLANTASPCSNPPIYEVTMVVFAGYSSFAVAGVSPATNALVGYLFISDLTPTGTGNARVLVGNASTVSSITTGLGAPALDFIAAGAMGTALAPAGTYTGSIFEAGSTTALLGPISETLDSQTFTALFVVGSPAHGSLQVLRKTILNVF